MGKKKKKLCYSVVLTPTSAFPATPLTPTSAFPTTPLTPTSAFPATAQPTRRALPSARPCRTTRYRRSLTWMCAAGTRAVPCGRCV